MLNILYLLTLFLFVDAGDTQTNLLRKLQPRIWNGSPTNRYYFPYQVSLYMPNGTFKGCGGTLISKSFVLTAAHCTINVKSDGVSWETTREAIVIFGMSKYYSPKNDPDSYFVRVNKTDINTHPLYDLNSHYNDIALIKLPFEVTLTPYVQLAFLPPTNGSMDFIVGQQLFSSGWGLLGDDDNKRPTELQYIITQIVPENECIHPKINSFNNDMNICINAPNRSLCRGDSGGPNVIFAPEPILIGISSHLTIPSSKNLKNFNVTCEAGLPQVLTRVSYYLSWIHHHTGIPIY